MVYTGEGIRELVGAGRERLFASYAVGRSPNWVCDVRTRDVVCLSVWLREELTSIGLDELGRKTLEGEFNRYSRSDDDLFELAADIMNKALSNDIDRDRKTHRRWG
jgi:hypothetical protein